MKLDGIRDWSGLVVLCAANVLAGLLEVFFVPLYLGPALVPVCVVAAVALNFVVPQLGRALVPSGIGTFAPIVAWLVPVLGLTLVTRPERDVIIAGGNAEQYVFYAVLLLGCISGFAAAVIALPAPAPRSEHSRRQPLPNKIARR